MKQHRGLGFVFQPQYRDKRTGELKTAATWWISYPNHGKQIRENARTANRAEAMRLLKLRTGQVGLGQPVGPQLERTTLNDLLKLVADDYAANGRRSLDRVLQASAHLRDHFRADRKARDITTDLITEYKARRLEQAKPSTVNYELAVLRRGFRLGRSRVPSRPDFEMLHVDNARKGFFEPEQHRAVLAHLPEYLKPVAAVAYVTGWRTKSELLTRQWRHVDFGNGWLRLEPGESKNGEGREFPFTPELRVVLEAQRERVRMIERATGQIIPWVFVHFDSDGRTPLGSPIKDFRGAWAKACRAAGVPGRLVHDFRRTAVRNLERAGVPRSAAMRMTGHKTEAVYRRYAIVDSGMLQEAAAKLAALHAAEANCQSCDKVVALPAER
jgi:integrase